MTDMFYAVIMAVILSGNVIMIYRPIESLAQCRRVVEFINDNPQPGVLDARCVGVIFDKLDNGVEE